MKPPAVLLRPAPSCWGCESSLPSVSALSRSSPIRPSQPSGLVVSPCLCSHNPCFTSMPQSSRVVTLTTRICYGEVLKGFLWVKRWKTLIRKKKLCAEVAKINNKNESSTREIVKKKKGSHASFAVAPQTPKVMATVWDRCLIKVERALISGQKTWTCVPINHMLHQKPWSL